MKRPTAVVVTLIALSGTCLAAEPIESKYHITAEERAACQDDAILLCSMTYPDEDKLLACMKLNRPSLSTVCRPVFEAGLKRRRLN